jgi:hypothetical protein
MESKKLLKEELQTLQDYQVKSNETVTILGSIELQINSLNNQKSEVLQSFEILQKEQAKTGKELQSKYGEGNINLENGEFTPVE